MGSPRSIDRTCGVDEVALHCEHRYDLIAMHWALHFNDPISGSDCLHRPHADLIVLRLCLDRRLLIASVRRCCRRVCSLAVSPWPRRHDWPLQVTFVPVIENLPGVPTGMEMDSTTSLMTARWMLGDDETHADLTSSASSNFDVVGVPA